MALDGAQRAPHGPLDVQKLGVDFYAFSGHKTYGPTGIGVLWGRGDLLADMPPFMVGGQMIRRVTLDDAEFADPPRRFEAGTPPIGAAIGLGAAIRWMEELDWSAVAATEARLTARLLDALADLKRVRIVGPATTQQRRGVVSFTVADMRSEDVCRALDGYGLALRHGHHCAQPLMQTLGIEGTARASLAPYTTGQDIDSIRIVACSDEKTSSALYERCGAANVTSWGKVDCQVAFAISAASMRPGGRGQSFGATRVYA